MTRIERAKGTIEDIEYNDRESTYSMLRCERHFCIVFTILAISQTQCCGRRDPVNVLLKPQARKNHIHGNTHGDLKVILVLFSMRSFALVPGVKYGATSSDHHANQIRRRFWKRDQRNSVFPSAVAAFKALGQAWDQCRDEASKD
jgi:hypothetical protein